MTELIKEIEEQLNNIKKIENPLTNRQVEYNGIGQGVKTTLEWVLSELKKRNCAGCKFFYDKDIMNNLKFCIKLERWFNLDFYCSNWEAK